MRRPRPAAGSRGSRALPGPRPVLLAALSLWLAACAAGSPAPPTPTAPAATPAAGPTAADRWSELLERRPFAYTAPLPAPEVTAVDGTYAKTEARESEHVHCLRCPDYLPESGVWKLFLDRGVFRIYYPTTGWRSIGSYRVEGERLIVFNDPNCPDVTGTYRWERDERRLSLAAVDDSCSIGLRAANLTSVPWEACRPPNQEAGVTDHWPKPEGCE